MPPTAIVMHPPRWAWFLTLLDSRQRPLFLPNQNTPMNAMGVVSGVVAEQVVGRMHGLPVITDPNIATTYGSQTSVGSEDVIFRPAGLGCDPVESGIPDPGTDGNPSGPSPCGCRCTPT